MLQTVEALINAQGHIQWIEQVHLTGTHRVLITILDAPSDLQEAVLLTEPALAQDWLNEDEDAAWAHLQTKI